MSNFVNRMIEKFKDEVDLANEKAFSALDYDDPHAPGPFGASSDRDGENWVASDGFKPFVDQGTRFKWVLISRGKGKQLELNVVSCILKHSVAAGGGDVITAGHGHCTKKSKAITIDNNTGHYQTTVESLALAVPAWEALGYKVKIHARIDHKVLFKALVGKK